MPFARVHFCRPAVALVAALVLVPSPSSATYNVVALANQRPNGKLAPVFFASVVGNPGRMVRVVEAALAICRLRPGGAYLINRVDAVAAAPLV